jgi:predicted NAD-dependent protein-ADP-ribosyltransferase YbiA (DUF1768 family)
MKFDPETLTLQFASQEEAVEFHVQVTALVRAAMVETTRAVEDPEQAKNLSRDVMKELRSVMRALNALRSGLPRKAF